MLWTPLFFGLHQKGLALVDILALTGTVGLWAKQLYNLGPIPLGAGQLGGKGSWSLNPAWFTVPYLAWLSYGESAFAGDENCDRVYGLCLRSCLQLPT
jgi:benzodiazapine receptor